MRNRRKTFSIVQMHAPSQSRGAADSIILSLICLLSDKTPGFDVRKGCVFSISRAKFVSPGLCDLTAFIALPGLSTGQKI